MHICIKMHGVIFQFEYDYYYLDNIVTQYLIFTNVIDNEELSIDNYL